jgi:hypothetical protein
MAQIAGTALVRLPRFSLLLILGLACVAPRLCAQAAAETAGATSVSPSSATALKPTLIPKVDPKASPSSSPHILASSMGSTVEANRQALESKAGKNAGRLLVRSNPSEAQVWINNIPVGKSPLLLIVSPGKYKIELRGSRQETASQDVALLPGETREFAPNLQLRYPTRVVSH